MRPLSRFPVFCDWLSMSIPVEDAQIPREFRKSLECSSPQTVHWRKPAWAVVKHGGAFNQSSSSSSSVNFRYQPTSERLHINGNLGRWGRADNVWGQSVYASGTRFLDFLAANHGIQQKDHADLTRVDLTANVAFESKRDAYDWLKWANTKRLVHTSPKYYDTGLTWVSENWSAKVYDKIADLKRHKLIGLADTLEAELGYLLRFELTLRTDELVKYGVSRLHDWMDEGDKMNVIFSDKFKPLTSGGGASVDELATQLPMRLSMALESWRNGHNFRLAVDEARISRSTYQRLKRELLVYGVDISLPCNVTALRFKPREITPVFVAAPDWYRRQA